MMTTVRKYEPRDEQQLRIVAIQNYVEQLQGAESINPEDPEINTYLQHIIQIQETGKGIIVIAEQEKKLIGFVCLLAPENSAAFMSDLYVVPECRNKGVGSLLTHKIEEQARAMGADYMALRVAADSAGARGFYKKNQYQEKFVVMSKGLADQEH